MKQSELNKCKCGFYSVKFLAGESKLCAIVNSKRKCVVEIESGESVTALNCIKKIKPWDTTLQKNLLKISEEIEGLILANKLLLKEHKALSENIESLKKQNYSMETEAHAMQDEINRLKNNEKTRDFVNSTGCKWSVSPLSETECLNRNSANKEHLEESIEQFLVGLLPSLEKHIKKPEDAPMEKPEKKCKSDIQKIFKKY